MVELFPGIHKVIDSDSGTAREGGKDRGRNEMCHYFHWENVGGQTVGVGEEERLSAGCLLRDSCLCFCSGALCSV